MKKESSVIEIRKYSNRRLYDTSASSYVTLNDVAELIRHGAEIRVVDAKTGEDLTRSVMLQIICESKPQQEALPIPFLQEIIQASSQGVRKSLQDFLSIGHQARKELHHQVGSLVRSGAALSHPVINTLLSIFPKPSEEEESPSLEESPTPPTPKKSYEQDRIETKKEVESLKNQIGLIQEKIEEMIKGYSKK